MLPFPACMAVTHSSLRSSRDISPLELRRHLPLDTKSEWSKRRDKVVINGQETPVKVESCVWTLLFAKISFRQVRAKNVMFQGPSLSAASLHPTCVSHPLSQTCLLYHWHVVGGRCVVDPGFGLSSGGGSRPPVRDIPAVYVLLRVPDEMKCFRAQDRM